MRDSISKLHARDKKDMGIPDRNIFKYLTKLKNVNYKGLSTQLVATFVTLIIIPIIIIGYISVSTSSKILMEKAKESLSNSTEQTQNYSESMMEQIEKGYVTQIKFGYGVPEFFETKQYKDAKEELMTETNSKRTINNLVSTFTDTFSSALLLKENGEAISTPILLQKNGNLNTTKWYMNAVKTGKNTWIEEHNEGMPSEYDTGYILSYLSLYMLSSENKAGGLIVLDVKPSAFAKILNSVSVGKDSKSYIITPTNKIINQQGEVETKVTVDNNNVLRDAVNYAKTRDSLVFTQKANNVNYIASFSKSKTTGWVFVTAIPEDEIVSVTKSIRNQVALLGILCAIIAVLIGVFVSFTMTTPMKKLMVVMERATKGDLGANVKLKRSDEIGVLATSFNSMMGQIRNLVSKSKDLADKVSTSSENIAKISSKTNSIATEVTATIQEIANGASNQAFEVEKSLNAVSKFADEIGNVVTSVESMRNISEDVKSITHSGIQTTVALNKKAFETNKITTNVVENIGRLNTLVQNINKITKVQKTMSDQTKLL